MKKLQTEHGVFTNNVITKQTAQEVYQEWLANKEKEPSPTDKERLEALEQALLEIALGGM